MDRLSRDVETLRARGFALPRNPQRAAKDANFAMNMSRQAERDLRGMDANELRNHIRVGRTVSDDDYSNIGDNNRALIRQMRTSRTLGRRLGSSTSMGGDVYAATPRFYDPLEYWDLSGLPWNTADEGHRHKLHKWLRLYYATHYLVPILVDIFTRFPLVGMELEDPDPQLKDLYEDVFFNQLNYGDFLVSLGREFWVVGEAFPLASFDEHLGVWEREELLIPEDITIENFSLLGTENYKIKPPEYLKRLAQLKSPAREFRMLEINYPDLIPYLRKGQNIPISNVLLRQVASKLTDWDDHGTPILLRGLRTLLHEERLLSSQDAIAERLYSPLILAKLGPVDLGDGMPPFLPGPEEMEAVRDDFDMALASDFRLMVHHAGLDVQSVFGREQMPRLGDDFDRVERRLMQVFGVNPSLLSAGANSQPYASSALQAEFLNQILKTFQNALKQHYKQRALVMAEALGHQDYEKRGQTRIPLYEEVVVYDEEGNKTIEERPKYRVPEMKFSTLDLRDEATQRQFLMNLRQMGVPIPDDKLLVGVDWKPADMIDTMNAELKNKTISQQRAKFETYTALKAQNLPIPADLKQEVETALGLGPPQLLGPDGAPIAGGPSGGAGPSAPPGGGGIIMPNPPSDLGPGGGAAVPGGGAPPASPMEAGPPGSVPDVSNERRPGLTYNPVASVQTEEDKDAILAQSDEEDTDPNEWELARNQELREASEDDELPQRITVTAKRKPIVDKKVESKKYSIVDESARLDDIRSEKDDSPETESDDSTE